MHRFYMYHSFNNFHRNGIAAAGLFLAAKVNLKKNLIFAYVYIFNNFYYLN